jgi:hypothetical protein
LADGRAPRDERRALAAVALAALAVWLAVAAPLLAGRRTLYFRDVFSNHVPVKAFGAAELRAGRVPAFNPTWGLGQPFRGNPNALPLYPGNALYLVLPFWSAFNAHYVLHWLLGALGMAALARALGVGAAGALAAGLTYGGCGWTLSALSFYNLVAVAGWWPWVLWGAARGGRRGTAGAGLACGLALLAGEPVTAALGVVPLAGIAVARRGWRRGLGAVAAILGLGALVALPQIVAAARVLPFTYRVARGMVASQAAAFALHPLRLLELVVPLPFGWPTWLGAHGWWAWRVAPRVPYFLSLYVGLAGLWLALAAARRARAWAALAAAALVLAWLGGHAGQALVALSGGTFRYPEKFLAWFALAAPLLVARGVDLARAGALGWRAPAWTGGGLALAGGALALGRSPLVATVAARVPPARAEAAAAIAATQSRLLVLALFAAGALLALAAVAIRRRSGAGLALLQLAGLLQLWPLLPVDRTAPYRTAPAWTARLPAGAAVVNSTVNHPPWTPEARPRVRDAPLAAIKRDQALTLGPAPGVLQGLTYPAAPDLEGLSTPPQTVVTTYLATAGWSERGRWLRVLGVDAAALVGAPALPDLEPLDELVRHGIRYRLVRVRDPAPAAWWPPAVAVVPGAAPATVGVAADPVARVVVERPVAHRPGGAVRLLAAGPDRVELDVRSPGGLLVVRRAYHPLWAARSGGARLEILPVNLTLLGVVVPAGEHRVVLAVGEGPETAAMAIALVATTAILALAAGPLTRARREARR